MFKINQFLSYIEARDVHQDSQSGAKVDIYGIQNVSRNWFLVNRMKQPGQVRQ